MIPVPTKVAQQAQVKGHVKTSQIKDDEFKIFGDSVRSLQLTDFDHLYRPKEKWDVHFGGVGAGSFTLGSSNANVTLCNNNSAVSYSGQDVLRARTTAL